MSDIYLDDDGLFPLIRQAQKEAARNYIKQSTSFVIGVPEGGDKLHVMLIDINTKKMLKKINCARLLLTNKSPELLDIFRLQIEQESV